MLNARPVKMVLSLLLIFSLSLFSAGCASANEEKVIGESATQAAVSAEETADHSDSEIPDKFVMLKEVYNILSSPLGEPYRTPEYWGGEEIDMMKAGDNYLIALRNVQNQMHYLLYERETDSIIEIDTQGKRILWENIEVSDSKISFCYCQESQENSDTVTEHQINYDTISKNYTYGSQITSPSSYWATTFDIPSSTVKQKTSDFSCLMECYQALQTLSFQNPIRYNQFDETNICILNQADYALIRSDGWTPAYYFYSKTNPPSYVKPLEVFSTDWEIARFQSGSELYFPYPGFKIPNAYIYHFFPYTLAYNTESARYTIQPVPLLNNPKFDFLFLGLKYNNAHSRLYHLFSSNVQELPSNYFTYSYIQKVPGFSLLFEMSDNPGDVDEIFPEIYFSVEGQQITLEFLNMDIDDMMQEKISSLTVEGFSNFKAEKVSQSDLDKLLFTFTVESGYQLFGELGLSNIPGDNGGHLSFWVIKENTQNPESESSLASKTDSDNVSSKEEQDSSQKMKRADVSCPIFYKGTGIIEGETIELSLNVPADWIQSDTGRMFYLKDGILKAAEGFRATIIPEGQTIRSTAKVNLNMGYISSKTVNINGQEVLLSIDFVPWDKNEKEPPEERKVYCYVYHIPYQDMYITIQFYTIGKDNEEAMQLHREILESIRFVEDNQNNAAPQISK